MGTGSGVGGGGGLAMVMHSFGGVRIVLLRVCPFGFSITIWC